MTLSQPITGTADHAVMGMEKGRVTCIVTAAPEEPRPDPPGREHGFPSHFGITGALFPSQGSLEAMPDRVTPWAVAACA